MPTYVGAPSGLNGLALLVRKLEAADGEVPAELAQLVRSALQTRRSPVRQSPGPKKSRDPFSLGLELEPAILGAVALAPQRAATLRELFLTHRRFLLLVDPDLDLHALQQDAPSVVFECAGCGANTAAGICGRLVLGALVQQILAAGISPDLVSLVLSEGSLLAFDSLPIALKSVAEPHRCALRVARSTLDVPLARASSPAYDELSSLVAQSRDTFSSVGPLSQQMIDVVIRELVVQIPHMTRTSSVLGRSVSELSRDMRAEQVTFAGLRDDLLRVLARAYLAHPSYDLLDVAYLLGFMQMHAFETTLSRWWGLSPEQAKRAALDGTLLKDGTLDRFIG